MARFDDPYGSILRVCVCEVHKLEEMPKEISNTYLFACVISISTYELLCCLAYPCPLKNASSAPLAYGAFIQISSMPGQDFSSTRAFVRCPTQAHLTLDQRSMLALVAVLGLVAIVFAAPPCIPNGAATTAPSLCCSAYASSGVCNAQPQIMSTGRHYHPLGSSGRRAVNVTEQGFPVRSVLLRVNTPSYLTRIINRPSPTTPTCPSAHRPSTSP